MAGPQAMLYARNNTKSTDGVSSTVFDSERKRQEEANASLLNFKRHGEPLPFVAGIGRVDDAQLHRYPLQQKFATD